MESAKFVFEERDVLLVISYIAQGISTPFPESLHCDYFKKSVLMYLMVSLHSSGTLVVSFASRHATANGAQNVSVSPADRSHPKSSPLSGHMTFIGLALAFVSPSYRC